MQLAPFQIRQLEKNPSKCPPQSMDERGEDLEGTAVYRASGLERDAFVPHAQFRSRVSGHKSDEPCNI